MGMEFLETVEEIVERKWTVEGIPVLSAQISLPRPAEVGRDRRLRRINRYYRAFCRAYLHYCQQFLYPAAAAEFHRAVATGASLPQFTAQVTYCITCNQHGLWSLFIDSRERGGLPLTVRRGDVWDLRTGIPVPLSDFFAPKTPLRRALPAWAAESIRRQLESGGALYREDWQRLVRQAFSPGSFYVSPEGLSFFYQMYALAPAVEGAPTFFLPWGAVDAALPARFVPPPQSEELPSGA